MSVSGLGPRGFDAGDFADAEPAHAPGPEATSPRRGPRAVESEPDAAPATGVEPTVYGAVAAPAGGRAGRADSMPVVKEGMRGPVVTELQQRLNRTRAALGISQLPVTGTFGPQTRAAVQSFQKMWGLTPDAAVGPNTWRRLLGEPNPHPVQPRPGTVDARVMANRAEILNASIRYAIPPAILAGIMDQESKGDPLARSHTNDYGLMQINRDAHPAFFRSNDWRDPTANIDYGVRTFRSCLRAFDGDVEPAVAAYNAGIAGVRRGLAAGLPLTRITYGPQYMPNIMAFAKRYANYF